MKANCAIATLITSVGAVFGSVPIQAQSNAALNAQTMDFIQHVARSDMVEIAVSRLAQHRRN